jgi:hypothetical protein
MKLNQKKMATDLAFTPFELEQLSLSKEKWEIFTGDLYFREAWADLVEVFGGRTMSRITSLALLNLKPDAVVGRRMNAVLDFVERQGFKLLAVAPIQFTRHSMRALWQYDWQTYPVDRLAFSTFWYTSTEVLVFLLEDLRATAGMPGAVRLSRKKGHALAEKRSATQLRTILRPPNPILNFVHVADGPLDVIREMGIFFDRPQRRAILSSIESNAASKQRCDCQSHISRLEALYPAHDLDFLSSLNRMEKAFPERAASIQHLRNLSHTAVRITWNELRSIIDPETVDRWDFICIASNFIPLQQEAKDPVQPLLPPAWGIASPVPAPFSGMVSGIEETHGLDSHRKAAERIRSNGAIRPSE